MSKLNTLPKTTGLEVSSDIGSKKAGVIKATILGLTAAALQACAPAQAAENPQDSSEVVQTAQLSPKVINASVVTPQDSEEVDISEMSIPELQAEIIKIEKLRTNLELGMDSFTDDDPRWDTLDSYNVKVVELSKAITTAERAETAAAKADRIESEEILARARKLAGIN